LALDPVPFQIRILIDLCPKIRGTSIGRVGITFSKDRTADILRGRFIDRCYGVLGYEWLHMLTVLGHLLTPQALTAYLAGDPQRAELWATYHPQLFVSALTERTSITAGNTPVHIELASSITSPTVILSSVPPAGPDPSSKWRRDRRPPNDQHRHIAVHAGDTQFTAHLDPVTAPGGWQLDRNQHRITASRDRQLLHDETIGDSPLHTAFQHAVSVLLAAQPPPPPDLHRSGESPALPSSCAPSSHSSSSKLRLKGRKITCAQPPARKCRTGHSSLHRPAARRGSGYGRQR